MFSPATDRKREYDGLITRLPIARVGTVIVVRVSGLPVAAVGAVGLVVIAVFQRAALHGVHVVAVLRHIQLVAGRERALGPIVGMDGRAVFRHPVHGHRLVTGVRERHGERRIAAGLDVARPADGDRRRRVGIVNAERSRGRRRAKACAALPLVVSNSVPGVPTASSQASNVIALDKVPL